MSDIDVAKEQDAFETQMKRLLIEANDGIASSEYLTSLTRYCLRRHRKGEEKYGEGAFYSRDTITDLMEEVGDTVNYTIFLWLKYFDNVNSDSAMRRASMHVLPILSASIQVFKHLHHLEMCLRDSDIAVTRATERGWLDMQEESKFLSLFKENDRVDEPSNTDEVP